MVEVYIYRGNKGENVPKTVKKLIVEEGVQELPDKLCEGCDRLQEVTLPNGLIRIGDSAFFMCRNLLEINGIPRTVQRIGSWAFMSCALLKTIEFVEDGTATSLPHQLQTIDEYSFFWCKSLSRIKLPSSITDVGRDAFGFGKALIEANLSTTSITKISSRSFEHCSSLQTISLPSTLKRIGYLAFNSCHELVTVVVPRRSQPIRIGKESFCNCSRLANFVLPKDSTAKEDSFGECRLLHQRYGEASSHIVAGLVERFEKFPIHRVCHDRSTVTAQKLLECIAEHREQGSLSDTFGMTPFHILFSTAEPSIELLEILLESLPNQILTFKDANGKRPLDYFINNWTDATKNLLRRTLQKSMIDPLARWGTTSWTEGIQNKVEELLAEDDKEERTDLCDESYSLFQHYGNIQATSILEMALWKAKLKSGWTSDGSKRQALDREECRCLSGSHVVIPLIATFLGIQAASSGDD